MKIRSSGTPWLLLAALATGCTPAPTESNNKKEELAEYVGSEFTAEKDGGAEEEPNFEAQAEEDQAAEDAPCANDTPTCPGALATTWQLNDFQPESARFSQTYGMEHFAGEVTLVALLAGS